MVSWTRSKTVSSAILVGLLCGYVFVEIRLRSEQVVQLPSSRQTALNIRSSVEQNADETQQKQSSLKDALSAVVSNVNPELSTQNLLPLLSKSSSVSHVSIVTIY